MPPVLPAVVRVPTRLTTPRLIVRTSVPSDARELNALIRESLPQLKPWLPWAQHEPSLAETRTLLKTRAADFRSRAHFMFLLTSRRSGKILGAIALLRIDWNVPKMEIGYWCGTRHTGRGYMTEAARAVAELAFEALGAHRVEIVCDTRNQASRAVAERLGFKLEGVHRHERRAPDGALADTCFYAATR